MLKRLKKFVAGFRPGKAEIVLEADGFAVARNGERLAEVRWSEVREVFAFKEDWGTCDCICLGFRVSDAGDCFAVSEDMPGYQLLLEALARVFPEHATGWWAKVAFPAFATNYTTLWARPPT